MGEATAVDGIADSLAHSEIVERLASEVDMQRVETTWLGPINDGVRLALLDRLHPAWRACTFDDVHLAGKKRQSPRRCVEYILNLEFRRGRRTRVMILER